MNIFVLVYVAEIKNLNLGYFVITNLSILITHILLCEKCWKNILELYLSDIYCKFICKHSYRRHEKLCHTLQHKHPLEQAVKTEPFIFPIFNESDKILAEDDSDKDAAERDSQLYNVVPNKYSENSDYSDSNELIVWEFLRYYSDRFLNVRTIGKISHLLIDHSKFKKQIDSNYYAAFFTLIDILEIREELAGGGMLNELVIQLVKVAKKDVNSFWDMMIIVFTLGYEFLQKYPHLYLEIKDMLLQFLSESSDDIERLGGWTNCVHYCSNRNIGV